MSLKKAKGNSRRIPQKAGIASAKKQPKNLPVGSSMRRNAKKGNSTPDVKKTRSTARFFETKIRMPMADYDRGQPYFHEEKYLSRYVLDAYLERVNRAEANNKSTRARILAGNIDLLLPIIKEMHQQGLLGFLKTGGE